MSASGTDAVGTVPDEPGLFLPSFFFPLLLALSCAAGAWRFVFSDFGLFLCVDLDLYQEPGP